MPSANFGDSRFRIDYSVSQIQQDIANNRSLIRRVLVMVKQGSSYAYSSAANSWSSTGPTTHSGSFTFNFGNYSSLLLMDHYEWVGHNADGTLSFTSAASVSADLPNGWGSASTSQTVWLTTIPRATTPKLPTGVSGLTTGVAQTIELPRASTGFTHDVTWTLGSQSGTVATGAGTSATVTLPHTVMTELPNAVSGNVTFTTVTKSGATVIGTNNTAFPLTAAESVLPTVTSVSWADQNTTVQTNIGAFVQGLSLVKGTIVAAGIHGSTISSRSVVISGNTLPDNTVFQVDGSGTIAASGMVTDSRGRTASMAANFTVLPYEVPKIGVDGWSVKRANSSNVADDNGQYLRIDLHAIAKSLMPSTVEKNALQISVRTRPTNGAWTNRNVINPGLTHNTSFQVSGGAAYLVAQSYEVEISLSDNTGVSPVVLRTTVGTTIVTIDLRGNQVGIGKMHELGTLDVAGDIYANGKKVLVTGEVAGTDITSGTVPAARLPLATAATRGAVLLASQAEVNAGTDNSKYVSPLGLKTSDHVRQIVNLTSANIGLANSTGSSLSFDSDGLVTFTGSSNTFQIMNIFEAGWRYYFIGNIAATTPAGGSLWIRYMNGSSYTTAAIYHFAGNLSRYTTSITGYSSAAGVSMPVGYGDGASPAYFQMNLDFQNVMTTTTASTVRVSTFCHNNATYVDGIGVHTPLNAINGFAFFGAVTADTIKSATFRIYRERL